jgi:hypothetical protein
LNDLHIINETQAIVPYEKFYNHEVCETINLAKDYEQWRSSKNVFRFSIPYLLFPLTFSLLPRSGGVKKKKKQLKKTSEKRTKRYAGIVLEGEDFRGCNCGMKGFFLFFFCFLYYCLSNISCSFCRYPFLLTAQAKTNILQIDANLQQQISFHESLVHASDPFFILRIRRDRILIFLLIVYFLYLSFTRIDIIEDTLTQIAQHPPWTFKKPLKVVFEGEAGVDEGGVRKEYFQLVTRHILFIFLNSFIYLYFYLNIYIYF